MSKNKKQELQDLNALTWAGDPASKETESAATAILLVNAIDQERHLLKGVLKAGPYRFFEARCADEATAILQHHNVDLVIADAELQEINGVELCARIKRNRRTRFVPVLLITDAEDSDDPPLETELGADDFVARPLRPAAVRSRVRAMLRNKRAIDSLEEAETILFALAQIVEHRDKETSNHCQRLGALGVALGTALGLPEPDLVALYRGGYLHDIGKIAVPDSILFKEGALSPEEWVIMRAHTWKGESLCSPMRSLAPVLPIIRNHHERWDGSGYPDQLAGEQIPLLARVLQLADIYDALTSRRSYKQPFPAEQAIAILREEAQRGWRDPELVSVFCAMVEQPGFVKRSEDLFLAVTHSAETIDGFTDMGQSLLRMGKELLR